MIFSDGECPNCLAPQLHLNTKDLFECPNCHLVCACIDGLVATIMPFQGESKFRFEDCMIAPFVGIAFAKSKNGTVIPDLKEVFSSKNDLQEYLKEFTKSENKVSEGVELSRRFLSSFQNFISNCEAQKLGRAFESKPKRTSFYRDLAMPAIAKDLGLVHGNELFKIDYVMSKVSIREHAIPKIFIESENDFNSADHEIKKLCSINAPLRILITYTDKELLKEPGIGAYEKLRKWQSIVMSHHELNEDFFGVLGVVMARKVGDEIIFQACAFRNSGDLLRPLSVLASRNVG